MKDVSRLTLEEKVGQLFFLGFQGSALDSESRALIDRLRPGGFIFFQRNIDSLDQIQSLTASLRDRFGLPALLAIDHEGGRVDRLKHLFGPIPSMPHLADMGTAHLRAGARIIASELDAAGFNLNFGPVVDLKSVGSTMADRTLSSSPVEVSRLAAAFVEELSRKNILTCLKHFPGLGFATRDPHFALPRIERNKRQLQTEDMLPFLNLVDETGMIMVSHGHYPGLGDERPLPASLSYRVIEGFLRRKLGFNGVVITDDLTMGAITSVGLTPDLFLSAFEAGNDMLLFSQSTPLVEQAFKTIVRAARGSETLRSRLDASVLRIHALKSRLQYTPSRYRAHIRTRILRQIEKNFRDRSLNSAQSVS